MSVHSRSSWHFLRRPITIKQMERLKNWHRAQRGKHPAEHHVWEAVLTLWMMGWIGWLPACIFEDYWTYPLCVLGILTPQCYVYLRERAHQTLRLRCDWLDLVA